MAIPQGEKYCVRCLEKGHSCVAQTTDADDRPVCVFCADGEPCPVDRRETKEQKRTAEPEKESATEKETMPEETTETAVKRCKCGAELNQKNRSGLCNKCYGRRWYEQKKAKGEAKPHKAKSRATAKPASHSSTLAVSMSREADQIRKGISKAVSEALAPFPRDRGQLTVNQSQLTRMIAALPFEDQLAMVNDWLSRQA